MKIAQIAPLYESVPPQGYGGTERVVSFLTEELVRQGHEVTLFASADSVTRARLVPCCDRSLRLHPECVDQLAHHFVMLDRVFQMAHRFDLIHFHIDYLHYPISRRQRLRHVTTLHGRLDLPDLQPLYRRYADVPVISISDRQRIPIPWANWQATVYHGVPAHLHTFRATPGAYLAFLGRISPEKRPDRAIEIACRTGVPLKIAAKVSNVDYEYFKAQIEPLIQRCGHLVEFLGEVGAEAKDRFLGEALALLFPIDWPEPFGLAMIESMACGTPVIAFRGGSVAEVMADPATGFVVQTVDEAVAAVVEVASLPRWRCRRAFEERFTAERMARDYLAVYRRLLQEPRSTSGARDRVGKSRRPLARVPHDTGVGSNSQVNGNEPSGKRQRLPR